MSEDTPVKETGKERAQKRLLEKMKWQQEFYMNSAPFKPSRQNIRWLRRLIAKKEAAEAKAKAIWGPSGKAA